MKKLILILFTAVFFANAHAEVPGRILVISCYQSFVINSSEEYRVLANQPFKIGTTNEGDFVSVDVIDYSTNMVLTTLEGKDMFVPVLGEKYILKPHDATIFDPNFPTGIIVPTIPELTIAEVNNPDNCFAFGELLDLSASLYPGLCMHDWEIYNPNTGQSTYSSSDQFTIPLDEEFCTPPPGTNWAGGKRCLPDVTITLHIYPCDLNDPNCPEIEVSQNIEVCCNNCREYEPIHDKKDASTSIADRSNQSELSIYPNPAKHTVNLNATQGAEVNIYTSNGQIIKSLKSNLLTTTIDVKNWPEGVYLVKVKTSQGFIHTQIFTIVK